MKRKAKSWSEKFLHPSNPELKTIEKSYAGHSAGSRMLIPTPLSIDAYTRLIPSGQTLDVSTMRRDLATEQGADFTCPLTAGIFLRVVSEKAWEDLQAKSSIADVAPFWRLVDLGSALANKLTCGPDFIRQQRAAERAD